MIFGIAGSQQVAQTAPDPAAATTASPELDVSASPVPVSTTVSSPTTGSPTTTGPTTTGNAGAPNDAEVPTGGPGTD